jgi:hypothetical protein
MRDGGSHGVRFDCLTLLIVLVLLFAFLNGMNDRSGIEATAIATGAMESRRALALAAICDSCGPFPFGVAVARTIGQGPLGPAAIMGGGRRRPGKERALEHAEQHGRLVVADDYGHGGAWGSGGVGGASRKLDLARSRRHTAMRRGSWAIDEGRLRRLASGPGPRVHEREAEDGMRKTLILVRGRAALLDTSGIMVF